MFGWVIPIIFELQAGKGTDGMAGLLLKSDDSNVLTCGCAIILTHAAWLRKALQHIRPMPDGRVPVPKLS